MPDVAPEEFVSIAQLTTHEKVAVPQVVGGRGPRGRSVEIQATETDIQWRVAGASPEAEWETLVLLEDLEGEPGDAGPSLELQVAGGQIQWRVVGDAEWTDLIAVADLQGETGATPALTIGDVEDSEPGGDAEATITGTAENPVLNLTIPRGQPGEDGAAATITVGTVTTGAPGTPVVVTNVGTSSAALLNFTIPRGDPGEDGAGHAPDPSEEPDGRMLYTEGGELVYGDAPEGGGGGTGINPRGEWDELAEYEVGDLVTVGNLSFLSVAVPEVGSDPTDAAPTVEIDRAGDTLSTQTAITNAAYSYRQSRITVLEEVTLTALGHIAHADATIERLRIGIYTGTNTWNGATVLGDTGVVSVVGNSGEAIPLDVEVTLFPGTTYVLQADTFLPAGNDYPPYVATANINASILVSAITGNAQSINTTSGTFETFSVPNGMWPFVLYGAEPLPWRHIGGLPEVTDLSAPDDATLPTSAAVATALAGKAPTPTGTPDGTKFLRDDNVWVTPAGGGNSFLVVQHGSTASTPRPEGALAVYWIGDVEPVNAENADQWYDSTGD